MDAADLLDLLGVIRYGVPTSEKERLAALGALPGAPSDRSAEQEVANRYAAGYMHTQAHPSMAPYTIPVTSFLRGLLGGDPNLQSYATQGMNRALLEKR